MEKMNMIYMYKWNFVFFNKYPLNDNFFINIKKFVNYNKFNTFHSRINRMAKPQRKYI